jgi:hypothetical protein
MTDGGVVGFSVDGGYHGLVLVTVYSHLLPIMKREHTSAQRAIAVTRTSEGSKADSCQFV